ncbi:hypothetical protein ACIBEA_43210 [Streptomyces sp. NPDC051555]|uniref:hypothetical protein n=1 Tax=Streptomyces sp. NPDC051555 TaxID=3365657 RepID=UPI0037A02262
MTTIIEQLQRWKAEGGSDLWQAAWERTIELGQVPWAGMQMIMDTPVLAEGAAALTTICYITAAEEGIHPREVTRAQVEAFREAAAAGGAKVEGQQAHWERRLIALGHDLHDPIDPVAKMWREISISYQPPADAPDAVWEDTFTRWGPGFISGLNKVFAPAYLVPLN